MTDPDEKNHQFIKAIVWLTNNGLYLNSRNLKYKNPTCTVVFYPIKGETIIKIGEDFNHMTISLFNELHNLASIPST